MARPHSGTDLNDFFEGDNIPPPHRLSHLYNQSPVTSQTNLYPSSPSIPATHPNTPSHSAGFQPVPTSDHDHDENPFYMPPAQFGQNSGQYANMDSGAGSAWLEKERKSNNRSKWIVIGSIVGLIVLIGVGVGVGVGVSQSKKSSSNSSSGSSSSGDASSFTKDPNLKQSFYGIAYTPEGSQLPDCGNSLEDVITDIQLLSQLTTRIRLYGADCNQSALVLEAIKQTKVNMTVWLGNYNLPTDAGEAYDRQKSTIQEALQTYGTDNIGGITVGNEFMLNYLNSVGAASTAINSASGNAGAQLLIANVTDTKQMLSDLSMSVPVGTSDAGAYFNNEVLEAVDYGMANVHPWFANVSIDESAAWTNTFFQEQDVAAADGVSDKPTMYIAETGWPTASDDAGNESNGPSNASVANLQTFLDTFICQANTNGTGYFFFEYFDEPWKAQEFGGVEGHWGLFTSDRKLKDGITIPSCS